MKKTKIAVRLFLAVLMVIAVQRLCLCQEIKIDGKCAEWKDIEFLAEDSQGDVGKEDTVDWVKFWIVEDNNNVYFSYLCAKAIDWNTDAWRYNIFIDTDNYTSSGYRGWNTDWRMGADYLVQGGTVFKFVGEDQASWGWEKLEMVSYSVDNNQAEVAVPYNVLGMKNGQKIKLVLYGDNSETVDFAPDDYLQKTYIFE